jgi:hypothetical protein
MFNQKKLQQRAPGSVRLVGLPPEPDESTPEPTPEPRPGLRLVGRPARKAQTKKTMILLHFCFDQQSGQTKNEHCFCEERAVRETHEVALSYVEMGLADWLIVRNAKAKTGTSISRKSIVIRSAVGINGKRYFKYPLMWERAPSGSDDRRTEKHEAIKRQILDDGKNLFRKWFSKGWVSQAVSQTEDKELEKLFTSTDEDEAFFSEHTRPLMRKELIGVITHWWNNVLGYHHLGAAIELYAKEAEQGQGLIVAVGDANDLDRVDGMHQTNTGLVRGPDPGTHYWNGGRASKTGTDPRRYESERDEGDPNRYSDPSCRVDDV